MSAPATLQAVLDTAAGSQAAVHYISTDGQETRLPYARLRSRALGVLGFLQRRGVRPGDELLLMADDLAPFVDTFWACMLGGIAAVPLASGASDEQRLKAVRVLERLARPHLLIERKALARLSTFADANGHARAAASIAEHAICLDDITDLDRQGDIVPATPDDIAFIQFSSGSTGTPKGVVLTHRNLLTTIDAINGGIGGASAQDSSLSWMPLTHDMGLIGFHLVPVKVCASHWLMTPSQFVRRPLSWLQKTAEHGVSVTCSPNFGYRHLLRSLDPGLCVGLDLSCVRVVVNGAEPISADLCREFLAAFKPFGLRQDVMLPVYGLAEASLAVTFPPLRRPLATMALARDAIGPGDPVQPLAAGAADSIEYVKVGTPVAGCELRIANTGSDAAAAGVVGRILIRGDNVTRGYYADAELTAATITADGWLDTGDLGVEVDGELVVTGRAKDVVFIAGSNHYPQDLEALLARHAGIETGRAAVVGVRASDNVSDDLVVFVAHKGNDLAAFLPTSNIVQRVLGEHAGVVAKAILPVRQIPKTTSGKLQRYLLAQEFAAGTHTQTEADLAALLVAAGRADRGNALENRLLEICQAMIPGRRLNPDDNLFEAGTNSLTLAQIYERVDNAYPGLLEVTDFFDYPTVRAMAHYLDRRIAAATSADTT